MNYLVKQLSSRHQNAIIAHYLNMDREGIYLRFGTYPSTETIEKYVRQTDFTRDGVLGVIDTDLRLLGVAHVAIIQQNAEIGFSVLPEAQGKGMGQALLEHAVRYAKNRGVENIIMYCLPQNNIVKHLAQKHGLAIRQEQGETSANLSAPPGNFFTLIEERYNETLAAQDEIHKHYLEGAKKMLLSWTHHDKKNEQTEVHP